MNLFRIAAAAAAFSGVAAAQDLNRLDLNNGQDILWILNAPFSGAPVSNFDPTGDLYWKAFPADVLQRCDGNANMMGINAVMFDSDFFSSETLWSYTITNSTVATDQTLTPVFSGAGVFVPGTSTTGTIFGTAGCAGPGYLAGWVYTETFVDTATSLPTPLIPDMTADGSVDWVFTHYFPAPGIADHDLSTGPINSCGTVGDATLQWGGSTDGAGAGNLGENMPDWTGLGNSIYSGFNVGGAGTFTPIAEGNDDAPQVSFYFDEPTLTARVDTDNGDGFAGPEIGAAALETPLQVSSGGVPSGGVTQLGLRMYDQGADTSGLNIALFSVNVGPTLLDLGIGCLPGGLAGADLALNPADAGFSVALTTLGLPGFAVDPVGPNPTSAFADSNLVPAGTGPAWANLELSWQGWRIDLGSGAGVSATQVFKQTLRFNDGV